MRGKYHRYKEKWSMYKSPIVAMYWKRVCVCVVEFLNYRKNTGHYKGANPDAMSEKKCMALFHLAAM